jgi:ATP-dependent Clp protease ATP-binding subunit ClpA
MRQRFTGQARRAMILAQEEARMLEHSQVGTEHLLLALTSERASTAGQILVRLGADLTVLRQRVMRLRSAAAAQGPGSEHQSRPAPGQDGPPVRAAISRHGQ